MKKILIILTLLLCMTGCKNEPKVGYANGSFSGEGQGMGGVIDLTVTIENGKITQIVTNSHSETASYYEEVETELFDKIIQANTTTNVDEVTGATKTSDGVLEAVSNALKDAKAQLGES